MILVFEIVIYYYYVFTFHIVLVVVIMNFDLYVVLGLNYVSTGLKQSTEEDYVWMIINLIVNNLRNSMRVCRETFASYRLGSIHIICPLN